MRSSRLPWATTCFSRSRAHLTLGHTDSAVNDLRVRAEANKVLNVESRMIDAQEIKRLVPAIDISDRPRYQILAGLYHPPGGIIRHDAVIWGYAREISPPGRRASSSHRGAGSAGGKGPDFGCLYQPWNHSLRQGRQRHLRVVFHHSRYGGSELAGGQSSTSGLCDRAADTRARQGDRLR